MVSHCCYTLLHCCYTVLTQLLHWYAGISIISFKTAIHTLTHSHTHYLHFLLLLLFLFLHPLLELLPLYGPVMVLQRVNFMLVIVRVMVMVMVTVAT
jgi:hypothetical protein